VNPPLVSAHPVARLYVHCALPYRQDTFPQENRFGKDLQGSTVPDCEQDVYGNIHATDRDR